MQTTQSSNTLKNKSKVKQSNFSSIVALIYISESEIIKVLKDYNANWEEQYPEATKEILWGLGLNTEQPYQRHDGIQHRNRFGETVICSRWVGSERHDLGWIESGYASREAIDRHKNSRLLDDSYRMRGMTVDIQDALERRDMYDKRED